MSPHLAFTGPLHRGSFRSSTAYSEVNFYEEVGDPDVFGYHGGSSVETTATFVSDSTFTAANQTLLSIENIPHSPTGSELLTSVVDYYSDRSSVSPERDPRRCAKRHSLDDLNAEDDSKELSGAMVGTACKVVKPNSNQGPFCLLNESCVRPKTDRNTLPRQQKNKNRVSCPDQSNTRERRNSKKRNSVDMLVSLHGSGSSFDALKWAHRGSQTVSNSGSSSGSKDSMPSSGASDENQDPTLNYAQLPGSPEYDAFGGISLASSCDNDSVFSVGDSAVDSVKLEAMALDGGHPSQAPMKPLKYLDLKRFDGKEEVHVYDARTTRSDEAYLTDSGMDVQPVQYSAIVAMMPQAVPQRIPTPSLNIPVPMDTSDSEAYYLSHVNGSRPSSISTAASLRSRSNSLTGAAMNDPVPPVTVGASEYLESPPPPRPFRGSNKSLYVEKCGKDQSLLKTVPPPLKYSGGNTVDSGASPQSRNNLLAKVPPPGGAEVKHMHSNSAPESSNYTKQESNYMHMNPSGANAKSDAVFCEVNLPQRRSGSYSDTMPNLRHRRESLGDNTSLHEETESNEFSCYMDMSTAKAAVSGFRSLTRSWSMKERGKSHVIRSPLSHSKSWDKELDERPAPAFKSIPNHDNYMPMNPTSSQDNISTKTTNNNKLIPFSNLIPLQHVPNKTVGVEEVVAGPPPLPPARKSSDTSSNSPGKQGFLSRLMRRNSKDKKNKLNTEDIGASYVNQGVKNESPASTVSNKTGSGGTPPFSVRRKGSTDLLTIEEEKDHWATLSRCNTVPANMFKRNQTPQYREVMKKPPPVPPRREGSSLSVSNDNTAGESIYLDMNEKSLSSVKLDAPLQSKLEACVPPPVPNRDTDKVSTYKEVSNGDQKSCSSSTSEHILSTENFSYTASNSVTGVSSSESVYVDSTCSSVSSVEPANTVSSRGNRTTVIEIKAVEIPQPVLNYTLTPPMSPRTLATMLEETVPPPVPKRFEKEGVYFGERPRKSRMPTPERNTNAAEVVVHKRKETDERLSYASIEKHSTQSPELSEVTRTSEGLDVQDDQPCTSSSGK